ncbi:hypothetical protein GJ496_004669 [Pomphorhynchus laevis]|nr:hypothetical protein GJ496_004669 [Pomphorhynchus laevis]
MYSLLDVYAAAGADVDSITNRVRTCASNLLLRYNQFRSQPGVAKFSVEKYATHQGDDLWLCNSSKVWKIIFYHVITASGLVFEPSKQLFAEGIGEFLRVLYFKDSVLGDLGQPLTKRGITPCSGPVQRLTAVASLNISFDEPHIDPNQTLSAFYLTSLFADNDQAADVLKELNVSKSQILRYSPTLSSSSDKHLQEYPNRSSCGGSPVNVTNDFDDLIIPLPLSNHAVHLKQIPSCSDDNDSDAVNQYSLCRRIVSPRDTVPVSFPYIDQSGSIRLVGAVNLGESHNVFNTLAVSDECDLSSVRRIMAPTVHNHPATMNDLICFP